MSILESALRDALHDPPVTADPPADPVARLESRLRRRAHRRLAVGGSALAAFAVLGTAAAVARPWAGPAASTAAAASPTSPAQHELAPPPVVLARARQIAAGMVGTDNRITGPIEWVATTGGAAERVMRVRSGLGATEPVYVIQVHGRFCCHPVPAPVPGHPSMDPVSRVIFEVLPASTPVSGNLAGPGGMGGTGLDLSRLGVVHTFPAPPVR